MNNKDIKVSVCVPTYNRAKFVGRAVRSIIGQTFSRENYEIIVVDDGSTDNTSLALNAFKNDIKLIKNKKKIGLSKSLNRAIKVAKGKYFLRIDSDDFINKEYINFLYMAIEYNKEYNAAKCDYFLVDEKETILKKINSDKHPIGCGIIFKIDDLNRVGNYTSSVKIFEEVDLMKKLSKNSKFKILRVPIPLYKYKKHSKNMTKNKSNVF